MSATIAIVLGFVVFVVLFCYAVWCKMADRKAARRRDEAREIREEQEENEREEMRHDAKMGY